LQIYFQITVTLKQQQKREIPRSPYWINYFWTLVVVNYTTCIIIVAELSLII
jgi:hypothetical protein